MNYGDIALGSTHRWPFPSKVAGVPTSFDNTPTLAVYEDGNTTEITAGLTLSLDFDGKAGNHMITAVASGGNGYASAKNYAIALVGAELGGVALGQMFIGTFSIENRTPTATAIQTASAAALTAYDPPTHAELTSGLASADDAVLAAIAALNNLSQANIRTAVGLATANLDTQLAALAGYVDTEIAAIISAIAALNNLSQAQAQTAAAAALAAYDGPTNAEMEARTLVAASYATAANQVTAQTSIDDLPTNAELTAALASADDAVLVAIAALNNLSSAQAQTAAAAALTAYDPPTNTEMEARTLTAASYATAVALAALNNVSAADVLTQINAALDTTLSATIPADGTRPTLRQGVYMTTQFLVERTVAGTTLTVKNPDGTTLMTLTLGDATSPASITRS